MKSRGTKEECSAEESNRKWKKKPLRFLLRSQVLGARVCACVMTSLGSFLFPFFPFVFLLVTLHISNPECHTCCSLCSMNVRLRSWTRATCCCLASTTKAIVSSNTLKPERPHAKLMPVTSTLPHVSAMMTCMGVNKGVCVHVCG